MADLLRPGANLGPAGRRRTVTRLTPGGPSGLAGRLKSFSKEGSDAPDSSRPPMHVKLENSYRMKPEQDNDKFQAAKARQVMTSVLEERLNGTTYDPINCQALAKHIAAEIQKRIKDFQWRRYRVVCQVTLGQQTNQGMQVASRCVWDQHLDNQASVHYDNKSVFAVAQCYGIYFE